VVCAAGLIGSVRPTRFTPDARGICFEHRSFGTPSKADRVWGTILASFTARAFQSAMGAVFSGQLPHDEAALRKGQTKASGKPPASLYKQCAVEVREVDGHQIFTVRPRGGGPVRGQVLYLHGGGYVNPPAFLHWWFIARLVKTLGVACTVPLYPRAPEHKCKVGIAFASEVYRQLVSEHGAQKLLVMGDSAGGGLALAMLQQTETAPVGLILNAPWLDASVSDPVQVELERRDWLLNRFTLRTWGQWWAGSRDLQDPLVSPLFGDLTRLPPTLMFCGSADILVADARRLSAAAPDKIRYVEEDGLMHVYPFMPFFPETRRAWLEIGRFVDGVLT
jgi:epsilon-lactone hydrolase